MRKVTVIPLLPRELAVKVIQDEIGKCPVCDAPTSIHDEHRPFVLMVFCTRDYRHFRAYVRYRPHLNVTSML